MGAISSLLYTTGDYKRINKGEMFQSSIVIPSMAISEQYNTVYRCPLNYKTHVKNLSVSCQGSSLQARMMKNIDYLTGTDATEFIQNLNHNYGDYNEQSYTTGSLIRSATFENGEAWKTMVVHGATSALYSGSGMYLFSENIELVTKSDNSYYALELTNIGDNIAENVNIIFQFWDEKV